MQPTLSLWAAVRARSVKLRGFRFAALPLSGKIVRFRLPVVKNIFSLDGIITVCSHEGKGRWLIYNDLNHLISIFTKNGWHRVGSGAKTGGTERVNSVPVLTRRGEGEHQANIVICINSFSARRFW